MSKTNNILGLNTTKVSELDNVEIDNTPLEGKKTEEALEEKKVEPTDNDDINISDDQLFGILSGKVGREIKSFDDLLIKEQVEVEKVVEKEVYKYNSPEAEAYDKYYSETGRGISDFANLHKDWAKVDENESVLAYLAEENPFLNAEDIKFKLENTYKPLPPLDPEEYEDNEVAQREKEIRMRSIEWKELVSKASKYHEDTKSKYITPLENKIKQQETLIQESGEAWRKGIDSVKDSVGKFNINGFEYEAKDKSIVDSLSSVGKVAEVFNDENGQFSHKKLVDSIILSQNINDILAENEKQVRAKVIQEQMDKKTNASGTGVKEVVTGSRDVEADEIINNFIKKGRRR